MLSSRQGEDFLCSVLPLGPLFLCRPCYWVHTYNPALMELRQENHKFEARDATKSDLSQHLRRKKDEEKRQVGGGRKETGGKKILNLFF